MFIPRPYPPPKTPLERFVRIIDGLCDTIAARGPGGVLTLPLLLLLWRRLRRMATRATRAAARVAAGTPQPAPRPPPASPRPSRPQQLRLPRGFAWVVATVPGTAAYGIYLEALMADPLWAPIAAVPSVRRMLKPLCQMLGVPARPMRPQRRPGSVPPPRPRPRRDSLPAPAGRTPPPPTAPVAA